jgi:uncharacterized protein (TIGR00106 family)
MTLRSMMYVAFLIVSPIDSGPSISTYVKAAIKVIEASGLKYQVTPMGTVMEAEDLESIFRVAEQAEEAVHDMGARRISITLKIDCRYDREISMDSKMRSVDR